jgi:hypothetical protein
MYSKVHGRLTFLMTSFLYLQSSNSAPEISPEFAATLEGTTGTTVSSAAGATTLTIDTARAYEIAVDVMREQYGANICYEDPIYSYSDDLENRLIKDRPRLVIPPVQDCR